MRKRIAYVLACAGLAALLCAGFALGSTSDKPAPPSTTTTNDNGNGGKPKGGDNPCPPSQHSDGAGGCAQNGDGGGNCGQNQSGNGGDHGYGNGNACGAETTTTVPTTSTVETTTTTSTTTTGSGTTTSGGDSGGGTSTTTPAVTPPPVTTTTGATITPAELTKEGKKQEKQVQACVASGACRTDLASAPAGSLPHTGVNAALLAFFGLALLLGGSLLRYIASGAGVEQIGVGSERGEVAPQ